MPRSTPSSAAPAASDRVALTTDSKRRMLGELSGIGGQDLPRERLQKRPVDARLTTGICAPSPTNEPLPRLSAPGIWTTLRPAHVDVKRERNSAADAEPGPSSPMKSMIVGALVTAVQPLSLTSAGETAARSTSAVRVSSE